MLASDFAVDLGDSGLMTAGQGLLQLNGSNLEFVDPNSLSTVIGSQDVSTINNIVVTGTAGADVLTIDLSGGWSVQGDIDFSGDGSDQVTFEGGSNADLTLTDTEISFDDGVNSSTNGLALSGLSEVELSGGSGSNTLDASGFSNNVRLTGGAGADVLISGTGNDTLTGGGGDDRYVFQDNFGMDTLNEAANQGTDRLDFSAYTGTLSYAGQVFANSANSDQLTQSDTEVEQIDISLDSNSQTALSDGLTALGDVADQIVNDVPEFTNQIPTFAATSQSGTAGNLSSITDWVATLKGLDSAHFSGATTLTAIVDSLNNANSNANASAGYVASSSGALDVVLTFDFDVSTTETFDIDLGPDGDFYGLNLSQTHGVTGAASASLTLGIANPTGGSGTFFTDDTTFTVGVDSTANLSGASLGIPFLDTLISSTGKIDSNGTLTLAVTDPDISDRFSISELQGLSFTSSTPSFGTTLSNAASGLESTIPVTISGVTNLSSANVLISLPNSADLFSGDVPQITGPGATGGDILDFANITPGEVVSMLNRLAVSLQAIGDHPELAKHVPFTGMTIGEVLRLGETFADNVVNPLFASGDRAVPDNSIPEDGEPDFTFSSIQTLATQLEAAFDSNTANTNTSITPSYDTNTSEVEFDIDFDLANLSTVSAPLDFRGDLGDLTNIQSSSTQEVEVGQLDFDLTFGIELAPSEAVEVSPPIFTPGPHVSLTKTQDGGGGLDEAYVLDYSRATSASKFAIGTSVDSPTTITWDGAGTTASDIETAIEDFTDYTAVSTTDNADQNSLSINIDNPSDTNVTDLEIIGATTNGQLLSTATFSASVKNQPAIGVETEVDGDDEVPTTKEKQIVHLLNATGGTFTLSYQADKDPDATDETSIDVTTAPIAYGATAAAVDTALTNVGLDVTVTKSGDTYAVEFNDNPVNSSGTIEAFADLPKLRADASGLTNTTTLFALSDVTVATDSSNATFSDLVDDVQGQLNSALHGAGWTLGFSTGTGNATNLAVDVSTTTATAAASPYAGATATSIPNDVLLTVDIASLELPIRLRRADVEARMEADSSLTSVDAIGAELEDLIEAALDKAGQSNSVSGLSIANNSGKLSFVTTSGNFTLTERSALRASASGQRMTISAPSITDSVDAVDRSVLVDRSIEITLGASTATTAGYFDAAYQELGLLTSPTPFDGRLTDSVELTLIVTTSAGTELIPVSLTAATTSGNTSIDDLVTDLQTELQTALSNQSLATDLVDVVRLSPQGNRIGFVGQAGTVTRMSVDVPNQLSGGGDNGAITGLGFLAGATKVQRATAARFYVDDVSIDTDFEVDSSSVVATAQLGYLDIDISGGIDGTTGGNIDADISLDLVSPIDGLSRLNFGADFDDLADPLRAGEFDFADADKGSRTSTGPVQRTETGEVDLSWTATPTSTIGGLNSTDSASITISVANWLATESPDLSVSITGANRQLFEDLRDVELTDVFTALGLVSDFLGQFDKSTSTPVLQELRTELLLVNKNLASLLNLSTPFERNIRGIQREADAITSVQALEAKLQEVFGSSAGLTINGRDLEFAIPFEVEKNIALPIGMDLTTAITNDPDYDQSTYGFIQSFDSTSATGKLDLAVNAEADLNFGIDLSQGDVFLTTGTNGTTLDIDFSVSEPLIGFDANLGPFPVLVIDGQQDANGIVQDGRVQFGAEMQVSLDNTQSELDISSGLPVQSDFVTSFPTDSGLNAAFPLFQGTRIDAIPVPTDNVLSVTITSLEQYLGGTGSTPAVDLPELDPSFDTPPNLFSLINDPNVFVRGVDEILEAIQAGLNGQFYGTEIPGIGPVLAGNPAAQFVEDLRASVIQPLSDFLVDNELTLDNTVDEIQTILDTAFAGVLSSSGNVSSTRTGYSSADQTATYMQLDYVIEDSVTIHLGSGEFDLAIPFMGFEADFAPQVTIDWKLELGLGVDESDGFYSSLSGNPEVQVELQLDLGTSATAAGTFGPLNLSVSDGITREVVDSTTYAGTGTSNTLNTLVDIEIDLNISDPNSDDRIVTGELATLKENPEEFFTVETATGEADVFLNFELDFAAIDAKLSEALPKIRAELIVHQDLEVSGSDVSFGQPRIALANVEMSLGSFFGDFLGPLLANVGEFVEPFEFLVGADGLFNENVPIISDLSGEDVSFKDLILLIDPTAKILPFLEAFEELFYLIDLAEDAEGELDGADVWLDFGHIIISDVGALPIANTDAENDQSFFLELYDRDGDDYNLLDVDFLTFDFPTIGLDIAFNTLFDVGSVDLFDIENIAEGSNSRELDNKKSPKKEFKNIKKAVKSKKAAKSVATSTTAGVRDSGGIDFPILDPTNLYSLLLGLEDVSLFEYEFPELGFNVFYRQNFPIVGPLAATLSGEFDAFIDVGAGYDTRGLRNFAASQNPEDLLDGFFVNDVISETGEDRPELTFSASIAAGVALSAAVINVGVEGGLTANIFMDLADLDGDGRIRADEFAANLAANNNNPLSIFDVSGNLEAFLRAYVEFNLLVTTLREEYEFFRAELFAFDVSNFNRPPILASQSGGDLILNIGPNAANRLNGDTTDGDESITVISSDTNQVDVTMSGSTVTYSGVSRIIAHGGAGDDTIDLSGVTSTGITVEVRGDEGDDTILGGSGADLLLGGIGNDSIHGGGGDDTIRGEDGNDTLEGGDGADDIQGGDGNDLLYDDDAANTDDGDVDVLQGNEGDDTITGGSNDMVLGIAQASTDTLLGSDLTLDLGDIAENVTVVLKGGSIHAYWGNVTQSDENADGFIDPTKTGSDEELSEGNGKLFTGALSAVSKVITGDGADVFHVFETGSTNQTLFDGGDGSDTYLFYSDTTTSVDAKIEDSGTPKLYITDTILVRSIEGIDGATADDNDVVITDSTVSVDSSTVQVEYVSPGAGNVSSSSLVELIVQTRDGADSILVESTSATVPVRVDAGAADDTLTIGNATNGVDDIQGTERVGPDVGPVVLVGGTGHDTVIIDDSADASSNTGSISAFTEPRGGGATTVEVGVVGGLDMGVDVEFESAEVLNVLLGSVSDTLSIGERTSFFNFDPNADTTDSYEPVYTIDGMTLVHGNSGGDRINVHRTQDLTRAPSHLVQLSETTQGDSANATSEVVELTLLTSVGYFALEFEDVAGTQTVPGSEQTVPLSMEYLRTAAATDAEQALQEAIEALRLVGPGFIDSVARDTADASKFTITFKPELDNLPNLLAFDTTLFVETGQGTDRISIQSIDQPSYIQAGSHSDDVYANVRFDASGALDTDTDGVPRKADANGVNDLLTIDGGVQGDDYLIYLFGNQVSSLINVFDSGSATSGNDSLEVRGTNSDDLFLLRSAVAEGGLAFIAMLTPSIIGQSTDVERINYNNSLDSIEIHALGGEDVFAIDDTRANIDIFGGAGADFFQIGQLYRTTRDNSSGIPFADVFATVETTRGFLSNGISAPMTISGGAGDDEFIVYRNQAPLVLEGDDGNDSFLVRAFALIGSTDDLRDTTDIVGGADADFIEYSVNAPVNIDGGDGLDTVIVIGTEFNDDFVVTEDGIFGAGLNINFTGVEYVEVDAAEGDDRFYVKGTGAGLVTQITGGLGSDAFFVNGPSPDVISNDLLGHSGLISHGVSSDQSSSQSEYAGAKAQGISANVADNDEPALRIIESRGDSIVSQGLADEDSYKVVLTRKPENQATVIVKAFAPTGVVFTEVAGASPPENDAINIVFDENNWNTAQVIKFAADTAETISGIASGFITHEVVVEDGTAATGVEGDKITGLTLNAVAAIGDTSINVTLPTFLDATDVLRGATINIIDGAGIGQTRLVVGNDTLTDGSSNIDVSTAWTTALDTTSRIEILRYSGVVAPTVAVKIVGNSAPALDVRQTGAATFATEAAEIHQLLDQDTTAKGFVDSVHIALATAPSANVTVTPSSLDSFGNSQLRFFQFDATDYVEVTSLTFTTADWDTPRELFVIGNDDSLTEGFHKAVLTFSAQNGGYSGVATSLVVDVADNEVAGVMVIETGNSTNVLEFDANGTRPDSGKQDDYRIVLTKAPMSAETVTVNVNADPTRTQRGAGTDGIRAFVPEVSVTRAGTTSFSSSETVDFTSTNWFKPARILVHAVDDSRVDGGDSKSFPTTFDQANSIEGPLSITGGINEDRTSDLERDPVMLLNETDTKAKIGDIVFVSGNGRRFGISPADATALSSELNMAITVPSDLVGMTVEITDGPAKNKTRIIRSGRAVNINGTPQWRFTVDKPWQSGLTSEKPTTDSSYTMFETNPNFLVDEENQRDILVVNDTDNVTSYTELPSGELKVTADQISGLGMTDDQVIGGDTIPGGIAYEALEELEINLGSGANQITIEDTHRGATTIDAGGGSDNILVKSISGHTTVHGGSDADSFTISNDQMLVDDINGLLTLTGDVPQVRAKKLTEGSPADAAANVDAVDAIQEVVVDATGGTFRLRLDLAGNGTGTIETGNMSYDASASTLQAALESLDGIGSGDVSVRKFGRIFRLDFAGSLAGTTIPLIQAIDGGLTSEGPADVLTVDDQFDTTNNQAVLTTTSLTGLGMGGFGTTGSSFNEIQTLRVDADGGTFQLSITIDQETTNSSGLAHNVSASTLQSALNSLLGTAFFDDANADGLVDVRQNDDVYTFRFIGLLSSTDVPQLSVDDSSLTSLPDTGTTGSAETATRIEGTTAILRNEVQEIDLTGVTGGTFTISFRDTTNVTPDLDSTVTDADLQLALEGLTGISPGDVNVVRAVDAITVTFVGELAGIDVPLLSVDSTNLTGASPSATQQTAGLDTGMDDVQVLTVDATGGTYKLRLDVPSIQNTIETVDIASDATAEVVRQALQNALAIQLTDATTVDELSDKPEAFKNDFRVMRRGNTYVIGFQGVVRQIQGGPGVSLLRVDATNLTGGGAAVETRMDGINYYGFEQLDVKLGSGDDVVNVQGTSRGSYELNTTSTHAATNLYLGAGDEQVFVSSNADLDHQTIKTTAGNSDVFDFLTGDLNQLLGNLNIDADAGRHRLLISDEAATQGDLGVSISDSINGPTGSGGQDDTSAADIQIKNLSIGDMTYGTTGNFHDGISYWTGSGNDSIAINGTHKTSGMSGADRTTTALHTGLGDDNITVNLDTSDDDFFVLNASGGSASPEPTATLASSDNDTVNAAQSTLPIIAFGGYGEDSITGGKSSDVIFGDFGRVRFFDDDQDLIAIHGYGGRGNVSSNLSFGIEPLDMDQIESVDMAIGANDQLVGLTGNDIILGGRNSTSSVINERIVGSQGNDVLLGDQGTIQLSNGRIQRIESTESQASHAGPEVIEGQQGADVIIGGGANDELYGESTLSNELGPIVDRSDIILGDLGSVIYDLPTGQLAGAGDDADSFTLDLIQSEHTGLGGNDQIWGNDGQDFVIAGMGNDTVMGDLYTAMTTPRAGAGDVLVGDFGQITFQADGSDVNQLTRVTSIDMGLSGGGDTIHGDDGDDVILGGDAADVLRGDAAAGRLVETVDGNDVILGDHGVIRWDAAQSENYPGTGDDDPTTMDLIATFNEAPTEAFGGPDAIFGNEGADIALGGSDDDTLLGDNVSTTAAAPAAPGKDVLLGDQGLILLRHGSLTRLVTTDVDGRSDGGDDILEGNDLDDILMGGLGDDTVRGEAQQASSVTNGGNDILVGDQGGLRFDVAAGENVAGWGVSAAGDDDPLTLDWVQTGALRAESGNDSLFGNDGADILLGGRFHDDLHGDYFDVVVSHNEYSNAPGQDVLLGDGGAVTFVHGAFTVISSVDPSDGGDDTISGNEDDDIIIGGEGNDGLYGEADPHAVVGDNLAGIQADGAGDDVLIGDNGRIDWALTSDTIAGRPDVQEELNGNVVTLDPSTSTLDRITTTDPTIGGSDRIFGNGNTLVGMTGDSSSGDIILGGTDSDFIQGDSGDAATQADGSDGADLIFGDHGKIFPSLPTSNAFFTNRNFFSIDTSAADLGGHDAEDVVFANGGDDIIIGGQDDDVLFGGADDDDIIGGHNVSGGDDELDFMSSQDQLAIDPAKLDDLNPADEHDLNDVIDGGTDDDVVLGDNAMITRQSGTNSPRFRQLTGTQLYSLKIDTIDNLAEADVGFVANVDTTAATEQDHQEQNLVRRVTQLDHSNTIQQDAADNPNAPRIFGNDVIAGGPDDDELFGQLGDDVIQGDGAVLVNPLTTTLTNFDPAQNVDPSYDPRNVVVDRVDQTLRFSVFSGVANDQITDGDDYVEGNAGNDRIYGNLGQDDLLGGSSDLFGLDQPELRPDGADLIYGGSGNPSQLLRNATVGGPSGTDISISTPVRPSERHAEDADTILGDNGQIYRILDAAGSYESFVYANAAIEAGYEQALRPRAVNLLDYEYHYEDDGSGKDVLHFSTPDVDGLTVGAGDLVYGESGDDVVHGMIGDDVLFGNSDDDDLYGQVGNDVILGGTGRDGILGDDGLILTSRNDEQANQNDDALAEPLHGIDKIPVGEANKEISTPGKIQREIINVQDRLKKTVEVIAFRTDDIEASNTTVLFSEALRFNDILFGGLGGGEFVADEGAGDGWGNYTGLAGDAIHGGDGDDAISGGEALPSYYAGSVPGGFAALNAFLRNQQDAPDDSQTPGVDPDPDLADNPYWFTFSPYNPGDILRFEGNGKPDEFALYDEFHPRRKIVFDFDTGEVLETIDDFSGQPLDFLLNFDAADGAIDNRYTDLAQPSDGDDMLFGDLGHDWIVGGTGRDNVFGGRGSDLINIDDDHDSGAGTPKPNDPPGDSLDNAVPDPFQAYADIAYGGAGRDVLILNTGADRGMDWTGEYNSFIVPFSPFGAFHITRALAPQVAEYLYDLSASGGADVQAVASNPALIPPVPDVQLFVHQKSVDVSIDDPDPVRNFEPYGELGVVRSQDFDWQQQTGAPADPQPGNLSGPREIVDRELFSDTDSGTGNGNSTALASDRGTWEFRDGAVHASPTFSGEETVAVYHLQEQIAKYTEVLVTVNAEKDKAGFKSNAYIIFDYQDETNFKFAGIDVGLNKVQIGERTALGWNVLSQHNLQLLAKADHDLTLAMNGQIATIYVNGGSPVSYVFADGLNDGMLGLGTDNALAQFDDFQVQQLPPTITFEETEAFDGSSYLSGRQGNWSVQGGELVGTATGELAVATLPLQVATYSRIWLETQVSTTASGGLVFDYYSENEFKFVQIDQTNQQLIVGHVTKKGVEIDASTSLISQPGTSHELAAVIQGGGINISVDGQTVLAHAFNGLLNDGEFGVMTQDGSSNFAYFTIKTDDPAYLPSQGGPAAAAAAEPTHSPLDTNNDGFVSARDALLVINELNQNRGSARSPRLDTNQDGQVSPIDALLIINQLNKQPEDRADPHESMVDALFDRYRGVIRHADAIELARSSALDQLAYGTLVDEILREDEGDV